MPDLVYDSCKTAIESGELNLLDDLLKVMLVTDAYVPSQDHQFRFDVTGEVEGKGYVSGGLALADKDLALDDDDSGLKVLRAANLEWPDSTITAKGAVLYQFEGVLIGYFDFDEIRKSENDSFHLNWSDAGILALRTTTEPELAQV